MNIYIFFDMEGVSGINCRANVIKNESDNELYELGCRLMEEEINCAIDSCFEAGVSNVIICDGHGGGNNVNPMNIDKRATLIQSGSFGKRFSQIENVDAMMLLGYHAKAGTPKAFLEHTYSSKTLQNLWLNNKKIGEIGIDTFIAADYDVPVILISGDDKAQIESKQFFPEIPFCCVKNSNGLEETETIKNAHELLRKSIIESIKNIDKIPLYKLDYPITLRLEVVERCQKQEVNSEIVFPFPDDCRITEITGENLEDLFYKIR